MNQLLRSWIKSKDHITSVCVIIGTFSGLIMLGIAIYELKAPQCPTPSTIAETIVEVKVEE